MSHMFPFRKLDLNDFPDDHSSSDDSGGGTGRQTAHHEDTRGLASVESKNSEPIDAENKTPFTFPYAYEVVKDFTGTRRKLKGEKILVRSYDKTCTKMSGKKVSTNEIIQLAREKFIQSYSQRVGDAGAFFGLSDEEFKDVGLVQILLASAEKVGQQKFHSANKLLKKCNKFSCNNGTSVQRLVYYFSEAIQKKINQETGRTIYIGLGKKQAFDLQEALTDTNASVIAFHGKVPFPQVCHFTGMQTIIENLKGARKVHIVDFEIRDGMKFTILMQALASRSECPTGHLTITAVGTRFKSKIENTGKQLASFAESLNLPFTFKVVMVADILDLSIDLFDFDDEEEVAVYFSYFLSTLVAYPDRMASLMGVIRKINPSVTLVSEAEANHDSPVFINRFIEALYYYGALLDSLEDCMSDDEPNRKIVESVGIALGIYNIVAAEGEERTVRHYRFDVWRKVFAGLGMVEIELSNTSWVQANLFVKQFECGSSCTLDMNGRNLIVGWKGVPIFSVSAWKFQQL